MSGNSIARCVNKEVNEKKFGNDAVLSTKYWLQCNSQPPNVDIAIGDATKKFISHFKMLYWRC